MAYTKNDVAPKIVNGKTVELSDAEKQSVADDWNTEEKALQVKIAADTQKAADKESANQKLRDLGLTDAEIEALKS